MPTEQRDICQRFDAEFMPPESGQKVGIALGSLGRSPLHAVPLAPENGTCGWYIYCGEYSADAAFYQPLHVAHLVDYCPSIVPYLALPPGWRVLLAPDYEDVWFDSELLNKASVDCGFNRSTQHILEIVEPGYRSLAFFLDVRLVDLLLHRVDPESNSTDPGL